MIIMFASASGVRRQPLNTPPPSCVPPGHRADARDAPSLQARPRGSLRVQHALLRPSRLDHRRRPVCAYVVHIKLLYVDLDLYDHNRIFILIRRTLHTILMITTHLYMD